MAHDLGPSPLLDGLDRARIITARLLGLCQERAYYPNLRVVTRRAGWFFMGTFILFVVVVLAIVGRLRVKRLESELTRLRDQLAVALTEMRTLKGTSLSDQG